MEILLTIIHVIVCLFLIVVVLLQSGKAGDISSAFGGMGSQTAFGPRSGATLLTRATTISAVVFMLTSLTLTILGARAGGGASTILDRVSEPTPAEAPATPGQSSTPAQPTQAQPQFGPSDGGAAPQSAPAPTGGTPSSEPAPKQ
jgi:preprotein translocase subunit SecG